MAYGSSSRGTPNILNTYYVVGLVGQLMLVIRLSSLLTGYHQVMHEAGGRQACYEGTPKRRWLSLVIGYQATQNITH